MSCKVNQRLNGWVYNTIMEQKRSKRKTGVEPIPIEGRLKRLSAEDENGCWIWQGAKNKSGYGQIQTGRGEGGGPKFAHRVSYQVHKGEIPEGMVVDHLCYKEGGYSNKLCVNPEHLELVSHSENQKRAWDRKKAEGWVHYKVKAAAAKLEEH